MINHSNIETWTKNYFSVYLYLCAIQADFKVTESELEEFLDQYDILKVDDSDYSGIIQSVLIEYKNHSLDDRMEFIKIYVPKVYGDSSDAKAMMDGIFEITFSDGRVDPYESDLIRTIQKVIS